MYRLMYQLAPGRVSSCPVTGHVDTTCSSLVDASSFYY